MVAARTLAEVGNMMVNALTGLRNFRLPPNWAKYAMIYDLFVGELLPYIELIENVVALADLQPGDVVVDAACGTGNLEEQIMASGHYDVTVYGMENSPEFLAQAEKKFSSVSNIILRKEDLNGDAWVDGVGEGVADVVFSVNTIYILEDPQAFFRNVRRVLKKGGKFVLSNPAQQDISPILEQHFARGGEDPTCMKEGIEINFDIKAYAVDKIYHFLSVDLLVSMLEAEGFGVDTWDSAAYAGVNVTIVAYPV